MEEQNNIYTNTEQREERKRVLLELKNKISRLTTQMKEEDLIQPSPLNPFDPSNSENQSKGNANGTSLVKSTAVGRKMSDKDYGYVSAIMLGFISLIMEILFLGIAILLFQ